ncbi:hypothetical protein BU23DRAFT_596896 [Bimuria novae-zelandiae CBS 107.79]|uniref:Uncharacterized protein n=1 Tax=Bimuria novae-zelandiae CBS 107.79 TaxID=1447943 RepID=A0A6A5VTC0_9PLEO|nr:hypothetical protein BU23DRAFT_596896 [Bimuria novae-zelandiae CBS 107.79]
MAIAVTQCEKGGRKYIHHCDQCKATVNNRCMEKGHYVCCEVATCGRLFRVISKLGCNEHLYIDGYNVRHKNLMRGLRGDHKTEYELKQEEQRQMEAHKANDEQVRQEEEVMARRMKEDCYKDWKRKT